MSQDTYVDDSVRLVYNHSRHQFNTNQRAALGQLFPNTELGLPTNTFFKSADHFISVVAGKVSSAVVPGDILRDCWAAMAYGADLDPIPETGIPAGTVLIGWVTDAEARKRGRFAVRGVVVHEWREVTWAVDQHAYGGAIAVMPVEIARMTIEPTVENNFSDGAEFPYGTPKES